MDAVRRAVAQVAPTDATVLILGETGTGKELVARAVHDQGARRKRLFVPVSCVALAPGLITSELFWPRGRGVHRGPGGRGSGGSSRPTGARCFWMRSARWRPRPRRVLLRALQERVIERVGGGPVAVDVRVVAATNRDLAAEVTAGRFRADLFYRLDVFPVTVPPLREPAVRRSGPGRALRPPVRRPPRPAGVPHPPGRRCGPSESHDWPGNVRELQNLIERAVIVSDGAELAFDPAGWSGRRPPRRRRRGRPRRSSASSTPCGRPAGGCTAPAVRPTGSASTRPRSTARCASTASPARASRGSDGMPSGDPCDRIPSSRRPESPCFSVVFVRARRVPWDHRPNPKGGVQWPTS